MIVADCVLLLYGLLLLYIIYQLKTTPIEEGFGGINFNAIGTLANVVRKLRGGKFDGPGQLVIKGNLKVNGTSHHHGHVYGQHSNWNSIGANRIVGSWARAHGDYHTNRHFTEHIKNNGQLDTTDMYIGIPENIYWLHSGHRYFGFQKGVVRHFFTDDNANRWCYHNIDSCWS